MPSCSSGFCSRRAAAAVYPRVGGTILIRVDHLNVDDRAADWRCADCLHDEIDAAIGLQPQGPRGRAR